MLHIRNANVQLDIQIQMSFHVTFSAPFVPDGSYMMVVDFSNLNVPEESEHFRNDESEDWKVCKFLIGECKLATIPLSPFYSPEHNDRSQRLLRLCFAKTPEIIEEAVVQIKSLPRINTSSPPV